MVDTSSEISLNKLLDYVLEEFKQILLITLCSISLCIGYTFFLPDEYIATAKLFPNDANAEAKSPLAGLTGSLGISMGPLSTDKTLKHIEILQSRSFLIDFINSQDILPYVLHAEWDDEKRNWKVREPNQEEIYSTFMKDFLSISRDLSTNLVSVSITSLDPQLSAEIANNLVYSLNSLLREKELLESNKRIDFLNDKLAETLDAFSKNYLSSLIQAETAKSSSLFAEDEFAFKIIDPAYPPELKSSPSKTEWGIYGILSGFIFSLFYLLGKSILVEYRAYRFSKL
tara:strand:- start:14959 stop:15816 length:858 start_codon:yes stop_codon:yes gene_type:complete